MTRELHTKIRLWSALALSNRGLRTILLSGVQDDLTNSIRILSQLAKKLNLKRVERGALTLQSPEVKFKLENDSQDPIDVGILSE